MSLFAEMGLRSLHGFYTKTYRTLEVLIDENTGTSDVKVDNLFINMNIFLLNIIHSLDATTARSQKKLLKRCFDELDQFVAMINPKKLLYLSFCGPLPMQDIVRRRPKRLVRGMERESMIDYINYARQQLADKGYQVPTRLIEVFDTNAVHFGTDFMYKITESVHNHISIRLMKEWSHLLVIVSDHTIPGSPSMKIMDYIRSQKYPDTTVSAAFLPENHSFFELLSLKTKNIYAIRRLPHPDPCDICLSMDHTTFNCKVELAIESLSTITNVAKEVKVFSMISVDELKKNILVEHAVYQNDPRPILADYVFLAAFYGAEPSLTANAYNGLKLLMDALAKFNRSLTRDGVPNAENIKQFVGFLNTNVSIRERFLKLEYMDPNPDIYYRKMYGCKVDKEFRRKLAYNYFQTVYWTHQLWTKGSKIDWEFCNTFEHPPHLEDLAAYAPTKQPEFFTYPTRSTIFEQLFASLPLQSYDLLPKAWQKLMLKLDPEIAHLFPIIPKGLIGTSSARGVLIDDLQSLRYYLKKKYGLLSMNTILGCRRGQTLVCAHESHPLCELVRIGLEKMPRGPQQKYWYKAGLKKHSIRGLLYTPNDDPINGQMTLFLNDIDLTNKENVDKLKDFANIRIEDVSSPVAASQ